MAKLAHVRLSTLSLALAIASFACGDDPAPTTNPPGADTGIGTNPGDGGMNMTGVDATPRDTGVPPGMDAGFVDTGATVDTGVVDDGGIGVDTGTTAGDAGTTGDDGGVTDTGTVSTDGGGTGTDGGNTGSDGGGTGTDGGNTGSDGGGTGTDGGNTGNDGGGTGTDAGVVSDAGVDGGAGGVDAGFVDSGSSADAGVGSPDLGPDTGPDAGTLQEFCSGTGSVVQVGSGGQCSGSLAENTFRFALCTCTTLNAVNLEVDAFDSRRGGYAVTTTNGVNLLDDGDIGVNGQLSMPSGKLTDRGSVFVSGGGFQVAAQSHVTLNVFARGNAVQGNSSTDIDRNMFIDGDVGVTGGGHFNVGNDVWISPGHTVDPATNVGGTIMVAQIPNIEPCACDPAEILDIQSLVDFGAQFNDNAAIGLDPATWETGTGPSQITLPCGRYYLTGINHPQSITITAQGRTVLYVDGDVISGGSIRLELDPNEPSAEIDVFITGTLLPMASLRFGDDGRPSKVRTYAGGAGTIFLQGNSAFGGFLYAPNADIIFNGSADLYGALFGNSVTFDAQSKVHFDSAIREAGDECEPPPPPPGDPCNLCTDCGNGQTCINIDPNTGGGVCGDCSTDLDCCPFDICQNGVCVPTL